MASEIQWQRRYIQRVRKEGGYGKKWSSAYTVGVPDLILSVPGFGLVVKEVKLEKRWLKNTQRTLQLTHKQSFELNGVTEADGLAFVLLIIEQSQRECYINLFMPPATGDMVRLSRDEALAGAFHWQSKNLLSEWFRSKVNET